MRKCLTQLDASADEYVEMIGIDDRPMIHAEFLPPGKKQDPLSRIAMRRAMKIGKKVIVLHLEGAQETFDRTYSNLVDVVNASPDAFIEVIREIGASDKSIEAAIAGIQETYPDWRPA